MTLPLYAFAMEDTTVPGEENQETVESENPTNILPGEIYEETSLREEIVCTPTHPFYVPEKGWTAAIQLRAGDRLQMLNGEYVIIEEVQHEILESPIGTYNFEVEGFHTYHVGNLEVLVHNKCGGETSSTINGKRMHQNWNYGDGVLKEKRIAPGSRVDGIDWANRIVYELKPNNPRAIQRGLRQLDRYLGILGEDWLGILLTY